MIVCLLSGIGLSAARNFDGVGIGSSSLHLLRASNDIIMNRFFININCYIHASHLTIIIITLLPSHYHYYIQGTTILLLIVTRLSTHTKVLVTE